MRGERSLCKEKPSPKALQLILGEEMSVIWPLTHLTKHIYSQTNVHFWFPSLLFYGLMGGLGVFISIFYFSSVLMCKKLPGGTEVVFVSRL